MSHRFAQLCLFGVLLAFLSPVLVGGRVLLNHDLGREIGAYDQPGERRLVNRLSDDQTSTYLPELQLHLTGKRAGWLATWNPHVELGRPAGHLSGFSRAFLPTHVLAFATDDALVAYSWLVVLALLGGAAFGYGFLRSLELTPVACLVGALGMSLNVWVVHRVNAAMFLWGVCWTLAILWATVRIVERVSLARVTGLAFAVHALLLTAYPQQVVWHAYFLVGFALVRLARCPRETRLRGFFGLAGGVALGVVAAWPVLSDLVLATERSNRTAVDASFFLSGMRTLSGLDDAARFVIDHFDPYWYGDPSQRNFPLAFFGVCTGALGVLVPLTLVGGGWRKLWGWQLLVVFAMAVSVSPALYRFGIDYLGLGLSRFGPPSGIVIPLVVLAAFAVDRVLQEGGLRRVPAVAAVLLVPALALVASVRLDAELEPVTTALGLVLCLGVVAFVWTRQARLMVIVVVVASFHYGFRLLPLRDPAQTPLTSPLVDTLRQETRDGSRFAWVGRGARGTLPANLEALVGLASVHAYDPLAWAGYREWVLRLSDSGMAVTPPGGGKSTVARSGATYGRHFRRIVARELDAQELARAGVSTLLSSSTLDRGVAQPIGTASQVGVFRTVTPAVLCGQFGTWEEAGSERVSLAEAASPSGELTSTIVEDQGDRLRVDVTARREETLVFLSRQFHPQWRARTTDGEALRTVCIDGFYQGVVVSPGSETIELTFRPLSRWMWLSQLAFLALGLGVVITATTRKARS